MNRRWVWSVSILMAVLFLAACEEQPAPVENPTAAASAAATGATAAPTAAATTAPSPTSAGPNAALTCPPATPLPANAPLAARVEGVGVPLDLYNRQVSQAQAALVEQGLDPKTQAGQDALKSLKQQVLDQMINDVIIALRADKEGIKVTDADLNAKIAQMVQDAGGVDKLNDYMSKHQLSLGDLCSQVRNQLYGEAMLNKVTAAYPTTAEQVHVRQILVSSAQLAETLRDQLRAGKDFAALANEYSMDEASRANGGDLGWVPKGVLDPQLDATIFQLPLNQISDVITTQYGYHIVEVLEKDKARPLPAEMIQNARQQAFLAWLQALRESMNIERFVQP